MRFSPGIYEHAAALIRQSPYAVSRSGKLLAVAHRAAWELYRHPLVVAGIDVYNAEPEAYGAVVSRPTGNSIPSIAEHPCCEVEQLLKLAPLRPLESDRIVSILEAGKELQAACAGAEVRVPVCGPFALAIGLLGLDELLVGLVEDPELLLQALRHLLQGQVNYLQEIRNSGLLPIFFESGTTPPLLPVRSFAQVEAPLLKELFGHARKLFDEAPPCIIGGDAAPVANSLLEAGPGFVIAPSETDQARFVEISRAFPGTHVRVNMSAACLLDKDPGRIEAEVKRVMGIAQSRENTSVGCGVVPFEADPQVIMQVRDLVESGGRG